MAAGTLRAALIAAWPGTGQYTTCMVARTPAKAPATSRLRLLLAMVVLVARLFGPGLSAAHAYAAPANWTGLEGAAICWASDTRDAPVGQHPSKPSAHEHDCLRCLGCQLGAQAGLTAADDLAPPCVATLQPGKAALPPTATGPPYPARVAARPTGPPGSRS